MEKVAHCATFSSRALGGTRGHAAADEFFILKRKSVFICVPEWPSARVEKVPARETLPKGYRVPE